MLVPVPWEATTSYGGGASRAPAAILQASHQVDLYDLDVVDPWRVPFALAAANPEVEGWNARAKAAAQRVIEAVTVGEQSPEIEAALALVNDSSKRVDQWVQHECTRWMNQGAITCVLGGDHSVPLGAFHAAAAAFGSFGVLHFDAHADLRDAYEGFERSHASIMRNACDAVPGLTRLVQIGLRDVCEEEIAFIEQSAGRIVPFFDRDLAARRFRGESWHTLCQEMIRSLPEQVWISFDVDGLDPVLCPNTGTPVPGGLSFQEAVYVLRCVVESGRRIVGFDLNEVAPSEDETDEWDANVGARLLYKLIGFTLASQGKTQLRG